VQGLPSYIKMSTGQYCTSPTTAQFSVKDYTVEVLINMDIAINGGFPTIMVFGNVSMQIVDMKPYLWNGSGNYSSISLTTDKWYHVCLGSDAKNYVNNVAANGSGYSAPVTQNVSLMLGSRATNQNKSFYGKLALCRFYPRLLTRTEVSNLYDSIDPKYQLNS
jgi:hypothetical protein